MASNQSVVMAEPERPKSNGIHRKESGSENSDGCGYIGVLEVFVHQARDIHNICIYHKQDVYAKLCLTNDPETSISTKTINGGGQNPVFNDNLRLNVRTINSSLKCEVWMLSRVRNYLEDQLLGFAVVPLADLFTGNGKLPQEFSLSSTDMFHSPAGFVQLSITYHGAQPDVFAIPNPGASLGTDTRMQDSEILDSLPNDYEKIEFPDPNVVNENHLMVSQYFELDSQSSESFLNSDSDSLLNSDAGVRVVESFSEGSFNSSDITKTDTPTSGVSTNGIPSPSLPASSQSFSDTQGASKSSNNELSSPLNEKNLDSLKDEGDSSNGIPSNKSAHSVLGVKIVPEKTVVQQEIVDMYMKSMQQFTESLAKMKLPMDIEKGKPDSENANGSSEQKLPTPKSRVFYGSRAFF